MQKMGLLRNVLKSGHVIRVGHQTPRISFFLRDSPRPFSTAGGSTTQDTSSIVDPFLQNPSTGVFYGTLFGIASHTTKNDVLNLLEGCNLTLGDLKMEYGYDYSPRAMLIQFPSRNAFDTALRTIGRKGRGYKLAWLRYPELWAQKLSYDGKALLLQGIPRNAAQDDIDRILSGYHLNGIMEMPTRNIDGKRTAIFTFPSATLARLAFLATTRKFCLNNQISAQVLY